MTILKRVGPIVVLSAVIALFAGAPALATPPTDAVSTLLARGSLGQLEAQHDGVELRRADGEADVAVFEVALEPGGSTGWHHHPGVGPASVASGAVTVYNENCDKTVYEAGEGFVESGEEPMLVQNNGNTDAVFYVTFIVPSGTSTEGLRIDDPQPENCDTLAAADGSTSLAATGGPSLAAAVALASALVLVAGGSGVVALTLGRRGA